ncbi:MAG: undecaprenyl diphosphate synthase family protein [Nanoarchaeota archaeon]|nr:undecaprenyl diphosphate synthase family protein [Nanoarchaeota archaeon]MBU1322205.1 undecaprenyl diphosphate synthase family protein [Nanoarchaeota archaeon]MBU1597746.1 undecaprenyl diphosphate synthase family protein [Nanoarchaeota archaeon]MBU2442010.1 undecaprenyl diphosphate synthase family protein [Nanoarchaeota archaeon]
MIDIPKIIPVIPGSKPSKVPSHIAINTGDIKTWAEDNKKEFSEAVNKHLTLLEELIDLQLKYKNRVLTINLSEHEGMVEELKEFFKHLINNEKIHENQMRVFIIGQWFDIDSELREIFKELMEKTKNYDKFFLNFCINYDGQEELLGAIKLIVKKILADKLKEEDLTSETIKENLYTSYFPPPELIIETPWKYSGILLWDSKGALIYFTKKPWLMFEKRHYEKAIRFYNKEVEKKE